MSGLIPAVSLRSCISPAITDAVTSFLVHRFRQTKHYFGLIWNDLLWAGTDTAFCYALAWCCRHFQLKQQPVSEEFDSFNQGRGSLLNFHSPKEGFLLFALYVSKPRPCQILLLHCNYNVGMRNYSQRQRQRCGSTNAFAKLTSSWQAGNTSAKKYLAGTNMPDTSGMQYVSLASRWLYVLFQYLWTILSCASIYLPWYFDWCYAELHLTVKHLKKPIFYSLFSLVPQLQSLYILSFSKWLEFTLTSENWTFDIKRTEFMLKGKIQSREQTCPLDRASEDRDGEKKKQWRVRIRNRWSISGCRNTSSTMWKKKKSLFIVRGKLD